MLMKIKLVYRYRAVVWGPVARSVGAGRTAARGARGARSTPPASVSAATPIGKAASLCIKNRGSYARQL